MVSIITVIFCYFAASIMMATHYFCRTILNNGEVFRVDLLNLFLLLTVGPIVIFFFGIVAGFIALVSVMIDDRANSKLIFNIFKKE